jgi:hypothetical protein
LFVGFTAEIAVEYFRKEEPTKKSISECRDGHGGGHRLRGWTLVSESNVSAKVEHNYSNGAESAAGGATELSSPTHDQLFSRFKTKALAKFASRKVVDSQSGDFSFWKQLLSSSSQRLFFARLQNRSLEFIEMLLVMIIFWKNRFSL